MTTDMCTLDLVLITDLLQKDVESLSGICATLVGGQTYRIAIGNAHCIEAVLHVLLKALVDSNLPPLSRLLLSDLELISVEQHSPSDFLDIGDSETRENPESDEHTHYVIAVSVKSVDKVYRLVPFDRICRCI